MAKINTNLGEAITPVGPNVNPDELYLNEAAAQPIVASMNENFEALVEDLDKMAKRLKNAAAKKQVRGSYAKAFKAWAKKSTAQAENARQLISELNAKFKEDTLQHTIDMLSDRLTELESKINTMSEQ